jgi:tetratricopeptide (TPR) repeat protein
VRTAVLAAVAVSGLCSCAALRPAPPPADYDKLVQLAGIYQIQGKWAQAEPLLAEAARSVPGRPEAWALMGDAAYSAGDYPRAVARYQESLQRRSDQSAVLNNMAMAHLGMKDGELAYAASRQALAFNPSPAWPHLDTLARALALMGRREEALTAARQALVQIPSARTAARDDLSRLVRELGGVP